MAKEKKEFNYKLYALFAFILVAAALVLITTLTFKSKFVAFDNEKVAVNFVDTIAQKGDGYNAYKFTLASKSEKYGDFVRQQYINPVVYPGYTVDLDKDAMKDVKSKGFDTDEHKSDKTKNDDGSLAGDAADKMLSYYEELMANGGWDDYDKVYTSYMNRFVEVRKEIFGDDYMNDEAFFTALEANVAAYGNSLTGTELTYAADGKTVLQKETTGAYQEAFGNGYKFVTTVKSVDDISDLDAYKAGLDAEILKTYGVSADEISAAVKVGVDVSLADGPVVASCEVYEVKIGSKWYVDNTSTSTTALYEIVK